MLVLVELCSLCFERWEDRFVCLYVGMYICLVMVMVRVVVGR